MSESTPATARPRVLVVDDDADILRLITIRLGAGGYEVECAGGSDDALRAFDRRSPQLVITDLKMQGMDGLALFDALRQRQPGVPVIVLTAHGTIPDAVAATQRGVFGFLTKPFDGKLLLQQVANALAISAVRGELTDWRRDIVTRSRAMEAVLKQAQLIAAGDAAVLIGGASGTGKELLAQAIHRASNRAGAPFVAVNCGAIPENLLESELFGHRKGAFTGATQDRIGLFQSAHGGSLFLDEIGDMPLALQVKLLRVLQERQVRPVGANDSVAIDVRIISATHRDLEKEMAEGRFREDLYYRLNVVGLRLPALAERREDVGLLANHFLARIAGRYGKQVSAFAPEALEALATAPWPGNVRQLINVVEQAVALATAPVIPVSGVQYALRDEATALASLDEARRQFERDYLVRVLKISGGNVAQAARMAQRNRTEFYKLLERHGLSAADYK
jgi:two-component system response regulator GlrR